MNFWTRLKQILGVAPARAPDAAEAAAPSPEAESARSGYIQLEIENPYSPQKSTGMSMFNYGVGGNEVKVDANEAIQEIQENKTLLVARLTQEEAVNPEIVTGLKTVEDVFRYYQPAVSVNQETSDGQLVPEAFRFATLADFTPRNLVQQSPYLKSMSLRQEQFNKIVRQLRSNKVLRNMLEDEASKKAFIEALQAVARELETHP